LRAGNTLTLGEAELFVAWGGMSRIYIYVDTRTKDARLAFDVNLPPMRAESLSVGARFLDYASKVVR